MRSPIPRLKLVASAVLLLSIYAPPAAGQPNPPDDSRLEARVTIEAKVVPAQIRGCDEYEPEGEDIFGPTQTGHCAQVERLRQGRRAGQSLPTEVWQTRFRNVVCSWIRRSDNETYRGACQTNDGTGRWDRVDVAIIVEGERVSVSQSPQSSKGMVYGWNCDFTGRLRPSDPHRASILSGYAYCGSHQTEHDYGYAWEGEASGVELSGAERPPTSFRSAVLRIVYRNAGERPLYFYTWTRGGTVDCASLEPSGILRPGERKVLTAQYGDVLYVKIQRQSEPCGFRYNAYEETFGPVRASAIYRKSLY